MSGGAPGPRRMDQEALAALYERARGLEPEARAAFVKEACGNDRALEAELASLLAAGDRAEGLFVQLGRVLRAPGVGHRVGQYRILGILGSGGMGTVYRAHDTRLDREVALKFLPSHLSADPGARERLLVEARAAAGLEHPNACTVHEIGETDDGRPFIAMACYAGETLKERLARGLLSAVDAASVTTQVGRALQAAHARGIVHRDVKPGNIMLCADGSTRLLDFGLAKLQNVALTGPGATPGTIAYMSPEQARGDPLDHRTDLWSLGVVLYEMLAGYRPFRGDVDRIVVQAILHQEPERITGRPGIPERMARIVERLLQKDPADRYQSAEELLAELEGSAVAWKGPGRSRRAVAAVALGLSALVVILWWIAGDAVRERRVERLAVLPLANLTGDPGRQYFVDGLHESLISELSRISGLVVISRQSMVQYQGSTKPVPVIARELGVDALLQGSVALAGDSARVTIQLVRADPEEHLWAEAYHRPLESAVALQGEIARSIAGTIRPRSVPEPTPREARAPVGREAQEAYLRGLYVHESLIQAADPGSTHLEMLHAAARWLERAVALAPDWALAHAKLASVYHWIASFSPVEHSADEYYPKSKAQALRAIELDEGEAQAHASLGYVLFKYERDWMGAERAIQRALQLDPNSHQWVYAIYLLVAGRTTEAIEHFRLAQERNPLSAIISQQLAGAYACDGRPDEAIRELQELESRLGETPPWLRSTLAAFYLDAARYPQAIAQLDSLAVVVDSDAQSLAELAHGYARARRTAEARRLLARIEGRPDQWYAPELYLALGDTGRAVAILEASFQAAPSGFLHFRCSPLYRELRAEPRIKEIVRRLRFPH